jgi:small subunit ribosomal protein S16
MTRMLTIRLQRVGKRNEPTFRIVVTDSKNGPKSGRFLEVIGSYDSRDKNETKVDAERVKYWMDQGAQPSDTLHNYLVDKKIIEGEKINVLPKKSPVVKEAEEGAEDGDEEAAAPAEGEEAPAEEKTEAEAPVEEAPAEAEEEKKE